MKRTLYSELAKTLDALKRCQATNNVEWTTKHSAALKMLQGLLPHGSGFDNGTLLVNHVSHSEKLVFETAYHHMNDGGFYDGWTEHTITMTGSLVNDFNLRVSGRNRNEIKDYIYECFDCALREDVTYDLFREHFPQFAITSKWENEDGTPSQCYQAFYVGAQRLKLGGNRFWNNFAGAKDYAAGLMETAHEDSLRGKQCE